METSLRNFKTVYPGDRQVSASLLNALSDQLAAGEAGSIAGSAAPSVMRVVNNTGQPLDYGACVGIESPLFEVPPTPNTAQTGNPDDEIDQTRHFFDRSYSAVLPTENHSLGIVMEPGDVGEVCRVALTGVVRAVVDVKDTAHKTVTFTAGTTVLESGESGILSFLIQPTATGKQWVDLVFGISGGTAPSGELGWGTPLSSMSPLNGAMVTKARTFPEADRDRYRRDIVYLGEEWENCIVREITPISHFPARPMQQLAYLNSATRSAEGLAKRSVISPNYLSPVVKASLETSSTAYFNMVLSPDQSKYTITWQDRTNITPRIRYRIDVMTARNASLGPLYGGLQSGPTTQTVEWTLPDLFCLYAIPIDANGSVDPDYAYSHAVFIDPSPLRPKGIMEMDAAGGSDEFNPVNLNSYLYVGPITTTLTMYARPATTLTLVSTQAVFFDLFTMEFRVGSGEWTAWSNGNASSSTTLIVGRDIEFDVPFEFSLRVTSRTTGRTQYTESMGWYVVTDE